MAVAGMLAGCVVTLAYQAWQRQMFAKVFEPLQPERYFDAEAIREATLTVNVLNGVVNGVVVNNTWKSRSIGVWGGFVKADGFHIGAGTGRNYHGYQYFPDVAPGETRNFSIPVAVFVNRNWAVIAEFDPKPGQLPRPAWK